MGPSSAGAPVQGCSAFGVDVPGSGHSPDRHHGLVFGRGELVRATGTESDTDVLDAGPERTAGRRRHFSRCDHTAG